MLSNAITPSVMAASITWPLPEREASSRAASRPDEQHHAAAAKIGDEIQWRNRLAAAFADQVQRAGEREVIDVVPRRMRERSGLAPARHAPVDELRIARETDVRPHAETLGDAGPEAFDQRIRAVDEPQQRRDSRRALQVERDRPTVAQQGIDRIGFLGLRRGAVDADDRRTHVGQHHGAERRWTQPREFDDPDSLQRSHAFQPHDVLRATAFLPLARLRGKRILRGLSHTAG